MNPVENNKMNTQTTVVQASSIAKAAASESVAQFWAMVNQYQQMLEREDRDKSR